MGALPGGSFPVLGSFPKTEEDKRDRAAKYVLTRARGAIDAAQLLDALGITPQEIDTRRKAPEAPHTSGHAAKPRRRYRG
jgi:hypothetical protein